jgi:uncharacterized protein YdeI (YjbR/CyaY-like superfamily)
MADDYAQVEVTSRQQLRDWLAANYSSTSSIWLVTWKKHHPDRHVAYTDIVDEALCFGWIDSLPRKLDADRVMLRLSPRKPKSGWSRINKLKIERLVAKGLMMPPGLAAIERAKSNGTWDILDEAHAGALPPDLSAAFARHPGSADNFAKFPPSTQRATLEWIALAKRAETRLARIEETARLAAENRRANQWRPKS